MRWTGYVVETAWLSMMRARDKGFAMTGFNQRLAKAISALLAVFAFAILSPAHAPAYAMEAPETGLRLFAPQASVAPGQSLDLAFEFDVKPGWHLYWKNPGDTGLAPAVRWSGTPGLEQTPLAFPTPQTFSFAGFTNYGYLRPFTLLSSAKIPADVSGKVTINAALEWLACDDKICVPESGKTSITLNVEPAASPQAGKADPFFASAREALPLAADWPGKAAIDGEVLRAQFEVPFTQADVAIVQFFPETPSVIVYEAAQSVSWPREGVIEISVPAQMMALESDIAGVLKVTPAGNGPAQGYGVAATSVAPAALLANEAGGGVVSSLGLGVTLPEAFVFALLGGILLNLMPCVFPVLSLKALALAQSGGDEKAAKTEGWFYTAGILGSFGALAGALLALRAAGSQLGWGFQLQSPIVVAILALVMFLIGLNLLGAFEFSGRFAGIGQSWLDKQTGAVQSFATGVLATVVATPCTAPLMAAALSFAITQPPVLAMAVFLALGFGLALPFLLLTYWPWLRRRLPRPGAWMDTFKQALAFPMFLTMLWLLWVLSNQGGAEAIILTLGAALLIGFSIWAFKRGTLSGGNGARIYSVFAIGALVVSALALWQVDYSQTLADAVPATLNEEVFSEARLAQLVEEGEPVFVYFTADWCITCKANERLALKTADVKAAFEQSDVTILKADWTRRDASIARVLETFGRAGVPLYLYYAPGAGTVPQELPQILRPGLLIDLVKSGAA